MGVTRRARALVATAGLALVVTACSGGGGDTSEVVDIAVNPWVGYEANAGVVGYLLDSAPPGEIEVGAQRSRGGARAVVRVQGFGIPAADQAELLRGGPDVSTPDRLGLFIARRIIEAHGGRIRVRSARGAATELVLFIPGTDA